MENPRIIGHVVSVQGFRLKVELLPETKSAIRATFDGVQVAVGINVYLSFSIGPGSVVIGMITDLEARESYDPSSGEELRLELLKPRRIANVQLLGTVEEGVFSPGIVVLPTLDTPAEIGSTDTLRVIFESPPQRNKPESFQGVDFDCDLRMGSPTGHSTTKLCASFNDLLSRPLAIVGNTGSGKSFTVTSLIQKSMHVLHQDESEPHVFVLDINGEYSRAFPSHETVSERRPNCIYLNGTEFSIPIWFFNAEEICSWLSAAEQTQEPVLKDWWAIAKEEERESTPGINSIQRALSAIDQMMADLPSMKRKSVVSYFEAIVGYLDSYSTIDTDELRELVEEHRDVDRYNTEVLSNQAQIAESLDRLKDVVTKVISVNIQSAEQRTRTSDSPLFIPLNRLTDPSLVNRAVLKEDTFRIESHLTTLKLRLKTRVDDRRWRPFLNYQESGLEITSLETWFRKFGFGSRTTMKVSVIDLSMLSNEVLPYACSVIGRILLEIRERLPATRRFKHPWVLVLEEAHNYARPARADEDRGQKLSRLAFERIAKEGRKFGMSLVIASQRPSEISPTIVSQCANFICHRLQNPDDIDHFRRIIPIQARRLLDQVTILSAGEAIVFGSAFHSPTRVQFDRPNPSPYSQTAAPFHEWSSQSDLFPLTEVLNAWEVG